MEATAAATPADPFAETAMPQTLDPPTVTSSGSAEDSAVVPGTQLSTGPDGSRFEVRGDRAVHVILLSDPDRWDSRLRIARQVAHPLAAEILGDGLRPVVRATKSFPVDPWSEPDDPRRDAERLVDLVLRYHELGVPLATLRPRRLRMTEDGTPLVDVLGLDDGYFTTAAAEGSIDFTDVVQPVALADDIRDLTRLIAWWTTGDGDASAMKLAQTLGLAGDGVESLLLAWSAAAAEDPADRPTIAELAEAFFPDPQNVPEPTSIGVLPQPNGEYEGTQVSEAPVMLDRTLASAEVGANAGAAHPSLAGTMASADAGIQAAAATTGPPETIGRYEIVAELGRGGMGAVYHGRDPLDGSEVAVKVVAANMARNAQILKRFRKEARLLASVRSPYVANMKELGEHEGVPFLVIEMVRGEDLGDRLKGRKPLSEHAALRVTRDLCRALAEAHRLGIIHRDIKPGNVFLQRDPEDDSDDGLHLRAGGSVLSRAGSASGLRSGSAVGSSVGSSPGQYVAEPLAKLLDFGLARQLAQSESMEMTKAGAFLGTPTYMSPEQCRGDDVLTPAVDVYAVGITLYQMLTGLVPFVSDDMMRLVTMHCHEAPQPIQEVREDLSDGVARIVHRCLAKDPGDRYPSAEVLLKDVEAVLGGRPLELNAHPVLPPHDDADVVSVSWQWDLESSPRQLWPYVSDTERVNEAAAVPAVEYKAEIDAAAGRVRRFGDFRLAGVSVAWEEHPFEWIEGQRMAVFREFSRGPFAWFLSTVHLLPRNDGGTVLTHEVKILPRGLVGRFVAWLEVKVKGRRNLDRIYRRIDAAVGHKLQTRNAFSKPKPLNSRQQRMLDRGVGELGRTAGDLPAGLVDKLADYLKNAPALDLARIRSIPLARELHCDSDHAIDLCLLATKAGLLQLYWDILCPTCRVASEVKDTLRQVTDHAHCEACDVGFDVDLSQSVEMIFRVDPTVRQADLKTYCVGGPGHSPHVVAQMRLAPEETLELRLELDAGSYALRGPQLPQACRIRVEPQMGSTRLDWVADPERIDASPPPLRAGRQLLSLRNPTDRELVIRLERDVARDDVVTAARAATRATFRDLFPKEVLTGGRVMNVATVTFLRVEIANPRELFGAGDASVYDRLRETMLEWESVVRRHAGAVTRSDNFGLSAAFDDAAGAVRVALTLLGPTGDLPRRLALHRGPALVMTESGGLDYFGKSVLAARELTLAADAGAALLSSALATDPAIADVLTAADIHGEAIDLPAGHLAGDWALRICR